MIVNDAYNFLLSKDVTRICHFTKAVSLLHILTSSDGILATNFLNEQQKRNNDLERLDNNLDFVNCSIEYPNTWYLKRVRDNDPIFKDWVIIFIDLNSLKNKQLKFCPCNAATANGKYIDSEYSTLVNMYNPVLNYKWLRKRTAKMLPCCPTDDQAELLIHKNIELSNITGLAVTNEMIAFEVDARCKILNVATPPIFIAPDLFETKCSDLIRRGIRPQEVLFTGRQ